MAFSDIVAAAVKKKGMARLSDLQGMFPGHSRVQIQKALDNANHLGKVRLAVRGRGGRNGGTEGVWAAPDHPGEVVQARMRPTMKERPPASVWELGAPVPRDTWPPQFDGGRMYGLFDDEDPRFAEEAEEELTA